MTRVCVFFIVFAPPPWRVHDTMSAVAIRQAMIGRKRIVNPVLTEEEVRELPPCVASHDMGTKNYTFTIVTRRDLTPADQVGQKKKFPCPLKDILRWKKWILDGNQVMDYALSVTKLLEGELIHKLNRVRLVLSEAQISPKAKHMLAISASMLSYYSTRKLVTGSQYPEAFRCVGAQSKFSYCMLGTPEGDENYDNRKRLSRLIVEYLMNEWKRDGLVHADWADFYNSKNITGDDKQDDYADCMLQCITELLMEMEIAPSWEALNAMYAWIIQADRHFASPGPNNWPLAMTAEGENALLSLMRKVDRDLAQAIKRQVKLKERLAKLKRKKTPSEEESLLAKAAEEIDLRQAASESVYKGLSTCISMIGSRGINKEARAAVRTKEAEEAEERKRKFETLYSASKDIPGARKKLARARKDQDRSNIPYLMQLENQAIRRGDEARLAYLSAAMGTIDEEVDFEELQDDEDEEAKARAAEYKRAATERAKRARTEIPPII